MIRGLDEYQKVVHALQYDGISSPRHVRVLIRVRLVRSATDPMQWFHMQRRWRMDGEGEA
jgi:hypothetical protein